MRKIFLAFCLLSFAFLSLKAAELRTITDMAGRKVSLPKEISSVVTIGSVPVINSFVMILGEAGKIKNALPSFAKMPRWKYQLVFAPNLKDKEIMQDKSYGPLIEKILEAKPDLVLTMDTSTADILEPKGINTVVLRWGETGDFKPFMSLLGEIFNKQSVVKDYLAYFDNTVAKAKALTKDIKEEQKPRVLYTRLSKMSYPLLIAEWWIKAAGGVSVTDDGRVEGSKSYSLEDLLKWNPDIITVNNEADLKELKSDPRFKSLKAVKNNKLYITPTGAHVWAHRTIEQPLTVLWALNKFYPQKYSEKELMKDVAYFYKNFFKVSLSENQLKEIITATNK